MSETYISAELRRLVVSRAEGICEYCLLAEVDSYFNFELDHIVGEKHGGATIQENLAYVCTACNRAKGSDVGSIDWESGNFVRFFNPRLDQWFDHFRLAPGMHIEPLTPIGKVTVAILRFNGWKRVVERRLLARVNRFPSAAATRRIEFHR